MKLTATFAVLAVFAAKAVVSAAPVPAYSDALVEARAEFVGDALEEVWSRFYDELLDEVDAREFEDEIFERAPMKKFATDFATNMAQKSPKFAKQYNHAEEAKNRKQEPRLPAVVAHAQAQAKAASASRPLAISQIPPTSKWNLVKRPSAMAEIKKMGQKRSLEEVEDSIFQRAPMKKFATDFATNMAQKAPKFAKQYSHAEEAKNRKQEPRLPAVVAQAQAQAKAAAGSKPLAISQIPPTSKWNFVKKGSTMEQIRKMDQK